MISTATSPAQESVNPLSKSENAKNKLSADMDNFLKLLTTQLKNQDPLEPLDTNKFTEQLVQFASVEQQISSNQNLEKLLKLQDGNRGVAALAYLGRTVDVEGDRIALSNGAASIRFTGDAPAAAVKISILDSTGNVQQTLNGPTAPGIQTLTWDGRNAVGRALPDGSYRIRVEALDNAGNPVPRSTLTSGKVEGVADENDRTILTVGGQKIDAEQVMSVRN